MEESVITISVLALIPDATGHTLLLPGWAMITSVTVATLDPGLTITQLIVTIHGTDYSGDPLWDGEGCPSTSTCCQLNNPPWFYKLLPQAMTNSIEVRLCGTKGNPIDNSNEDLLVELIELYIQ